MKTLEMSVAEAKKHFSDAVNRAALSPCRIVITRRSRPVAALVSLADLRLVEQQEQRRGLTAVVGRWSRFDEIEANVTEAVKARGREKAGRDVSL